MRRPTVLTMLQPPSAVPVVSASAHATVAQSGALSESIRPSATSRAAMTPTAFWASLAPWLNASAADIAHCAPRAGPAPATRRPAGGRRSARITSSAAVTPSTGATASATSVPMTRRPDGHPSKPPQMTASAPPDASAAPTSPPTSAWPELDGSPSPQVARFQSAAASTPAPMISTPDVTAAGDDAADRVGHGGADEQRAEQVADRRHDDGLQRPRRASRRRVPRSRSRRRGSRS